MKNISILFCVLVMFLLAQCSSDEGLLKQGDVLSLSTTSGFVGEEIILKGTDFPLNEGAIELKVNDVRVAVKMISKNEISFKVPAHKENQVATLKLTINGKECKSKPVLNVLTWKKLADGPFKPRFSPSSFGFDNKIFFGFGRDMLNATYGDFWEVNTQSGKVKRLKDFPGSPRFFCVSFAVKSKGYVALGRDSLGTQLTELWEYDYVNDLWTQKADFPGGIRDEPAVFVLNDKAYVGNGLVNGSELVQDFYVYDPETDSWSNAPNFPAGRYGQAAFVRNGKAYLVGGVKEDFTTTNEVWQFNGVEWKQKRSFDGPTFGGGFGFTLSNLSGVGFGVDDSNQPLNDFYLYKPENDSWVKLNDFPGQARSNPIFGSTSRSLYFGLGYYGLTDLSDIWVIDMKGRGEQDEREDD